MNDYLVIKLIITRSNERNLMSYIKGFDAL